MSETIGVEEKLSDLSEVLFRQVHPSFIQEHRPTSQAFKPNQNDQQKMSVSRSAKTRAKECFEHFTQRLERKSAGVWGVSVGEVIEQGLSALSDELFEPIPDPAHALVDFRQVTPESKIKTISSKLAAKAKDRGCLYVPPQMAKSET